MGDGRYDQTAPDRRDREECASERCCSTWRRSPKQSGAMINAVMLGAIAGCGRLPIPIEAFEAAIRADGKAVESNLRGFRAGLAAARAGDARRSQPPTKSAHSRDRPTSQRSRARSRRMPPPAQRRDASKACAGSSPIRTSAMRGAISIALRPIRDADDARRQRRQAAARSRAASRGAHVLRGRDPGGAGQDRSGAHAAHRPRSCSVKPASLTRCIDFLKPGIEEFCQMLPPCAGAADSRHVRERGWLGRVHCGMEIKTTSVTGYLRFWLLAKLRRLRPHGHRYAQEQAAIESWLGADRARRRSISPDLALEIAECARPDQGLWRHAQARDATITASIETRVIRPALDGQLPAAAPASTRSPARAPRRWSIPEGEGLQRCIDTLQHGPMPAAAE